MARPRAALSRDRLIAAALLLVDRRGEAALTMRNLGAALHVEAMSLYHHIRNRDDLLDGLADLLVTTGLPIASANEPWVDALRAFARGIRRTAQEHPAAFQLRLTLEAGRGQASPRPRIDIIAAGWIPRSA